VRSQNQRHVVVLGNERDEKRRAAASLPAGSPTCHRAKTRGYRAALAAPSVSTPRSYRDWRCGLCFSCRRHKGSLKLPAGGLLWQVSLRAPAWTLALQHRAGAFSATAATDHKRQIKTTRTAPAVVLRSAEHRPSVPPVATHSANNMLVVLI
jgi:hypothetical protein